MMGSVENPVSGDEIPLTNKRTNNPSDNISHLEHFQNTHKNPSGQFNSRNQVDKMDVEDQTSLSVKSNLRSDGNAPSDSQDASSEIPLS